MRWHGRDAMIARGRRARRVSLSRFRWALGALGVEPERTALLGRDGPANHGRDARATLAILNEQRCWAETAQQTTGETPVPPSWRGFSASVRRRLIGGGLSRPAGRRRGAHCVAPSALCWVATRNPGLRPSAFDLGYASGGPLGLRLRRRGAQARPRMSCPQRNE